MRACSQTFSSYFSNPRAARDYYYFECKAVEKTSGINPRKENQRKSEEVLEAPIIPNKYNVYGGDTPHIPVAVEDIPKYFTEDNCNQCVPTIRTIGLVRRLEHEVYVIESIEMEVDTVQIPLSRGTNRQIKVRNRPLKRIRKSKKKKKDEEAKPHEDIKKGGAKPKLKDLPFPDSVRDPLSLGDTRVEDDKIYLVLGKLQWFNDKPIIDVFRFIPVHDLQTTYESFMLQHALARRHMESYKAHPNEIGEVERRPLEIRKNTFVKPQAWKNKRSKKRKFRR